MCINCVCTSVTTTVVRPLVANGCREIQSPSGMVRQGKTVRWWKKKEKKTTARDDKIDTGSCKRTLHGLFAMIKVLKTDLPCLRGESNLSGRRSNFGRR